MLATEREQLSWTDEVHDHDRRVIALEQRLNQGRRNGKHPVYDFLTTYYSFPLRQLHRWSPGVGGVVDGLRDAVLAEFAERRFFAVENLPNGRAKAYPDPAAFPGRRRSGLEQTLQLLRATAARPAAYGCVGLHEWARVSRLSPEKIRHAGVPLRLPPEEIATIVERGPVRCTHWDAFRFFTKPARPLNQIQPGPDNRRHHEQPGCLHANMDLYRWTYKFFPWTSSRLLLDTLELAIDVREIDMRASPYDLRDYGFDPVKIETVEGRKVYEQAQRGFAERAAPLRERVISELDRLRQCLETSAV